MLQKMTCRALIIKVGRNAENLWRERERERADDVCVGGGAEYRLSIFNFINYRFNLLGEQVMPAAL